MSDDGATRQLSYLASPPPPGRGGDTYRSREARRLAQGVHPTGIALVGAPGTTCGTCGHLVWVPMEYDNGTTTYRTKCGLTRATWTRGRATEVLHRWPGCTRWVRRAPGQGEGT